MFANDFNRFTTKYAHCEYFVYEIDSIIFAYSILYRYNKSYLRLSQNRILFYLTRTCKHSKCTLLSSQTQRPSVQY